MLEQYHTRRTIVALARARGLPLSPSRLDKDCAAGHGPEVCAIYDTRGLELYAPEAVERYLASKIRPISPEITERLKLASKARQRARLEGRP